MRLFSIIDTSFIVAHSANQGLGLGSGSFPGPAEKPLQQSQDRGVEIMTLGTAKTLSVQNFTNRSNLRHYVVIIGLVLATSFLPPRVTLATPIPIEIPIDLKSKSVILSSHTVFGSGGTQCTVSRPDYCNGFQLPKRPVYSPVHGNEVFSDRYLFENKQCSVRIEFYW